MGDVDREAAALLDATGGDFIKALEIVNRQFLALASRAQVALTLCGIVVTVTGFSGRLIAGTNRAAQVLVIAGLFLSIAAAAYIQVKVMPLKWITSDIGSDRLRTIAVVLTRRDLKTQAYSFGVKILLLGIAIYAAAVAIMLLYPTPLNVPTR